MTKIKNLIFPLILILAFSNIKIVAAFESLNWDPPSDSLLNQIYCPIDSTADAMMIQKESEYEIIEGRYYSLKIREKKRVKIYNEAGLEFADINLPFHRYQKIKEIDVSCYNYGNPVSRLHPDDIHEETWVQDKERSIKVRAKSFAIPAAKAGSVIDIYTELEQEFINFLPPFVYHENIPVGLAQVRLILPKYLYYRYHHTNYNLIDIDKEERDENPVLVFTAQNIPAIEWEEYMPPVYELSTEMWLKLEKFVSPYRTIKIADTWENLFDYYDIEKEYSDALKNSKKARKLTQRLTTDKSDTLEVIRIIFNKVRDNWANVNYASDFAVSDKVDKLMEMESLTPGDKTAILCSMLRHAGIDCDIIWVCSSELGIPDFPSISMFDYALVYIPNNDLYLDPGDPGAEVGELDDVLYEKLAINVTDKSHEISRIPASDRISGKMIELDLNIYNEGNLGGTGSLTFYGQNAIQARRNLKEKSNVDKKKWVEDYVFAEFEDLVESLTVVYDPIQPPYDYRLDFTIDIEEYIRPEEKFIEINIYPGPTFEDISIDDKPPRKYPVWLGSKRTEFYRISWNFGDNFKPRINEIIKYKEGISTIFSFMMDYSEESNKMTVMRQRKYTSIKYPASFSKTLEHQRSRLKEADNTLILLERQ